MRSEVEPRALRRLLTIRKGLAHRPQGGGPSMTYTLARRAFGAASLALIGASASAHAQANWPNRPVTLIVPYAAGGSTDAVARILAQRLSTDLGQNMVVDN